MKQITFTQYIPPNGKQVHNTIERPDDIAEMAEALQKKGFQFSIEILSTGMIAMYCGKPNDDDENIRICNNGPNVPDVVDELVREAYQSEFLLKG